MFYRTGSLSMADTKRVSTASTDINPDPITGEPGAHPVGTGLGTAAGGAAAGAAGGAVGGPVGAVVGAVAGGIVGALAGKSIAESIDPTAEDAYWRTHYADRPYHDAATTYDEYAPAYRYGWESRAKHHSGSFNEVERDLEKGWESAKAHSRLTWDRARHATRDAWDRIERAGQNACDPKR
jgi:hypothetical protein